MTSISPDLLPEGFRDRLPVQAEAAVRVARAMLDVMASNGYARVAPAIAEFEGSLSARSGGATRNSLLALYRPGCPGTRWRLRGDITVQVGRIATTRLADAPRPLAAVLSRTGSAPACTAIAARTGDYAAWC